MCQALWEFFKTEIEQEKRNSEIFGERRGEQRGAYTKLISIIIKKMQRGKDILSISDALEEPVEVIRPIYEAVLASPGLNAEQIYKQVVGQIAADQEIKDYAAAYSSMKPKQAAGIFEAMTARSKAKEVSHGAYYDSVCDSAVRG